MKKLIASAALAASLLLPASAAQAAAPVHVSLCPTGSVGIIVWTTDPTSGNRLDLVYACVLITQ